MHNGSRNWSLQTRLAWISASIEADYYRALSWCAHLIACLSMTLKHGSAEMKARWRFVSCYITGCFIWPWGYSSQEETPKQQTVVFIERLQWFLLCHRLTACRISIPTVRSAFVGKRKFSFRAFASARSACRLFVAKSILKLASQF